MVTRQECVSYVLQRRLSRTWFVSIMLAVLPLQFLNSSGSGVLAAVIVLAVGLLSHYVAVDLGKRTETSLRARKVILIAGMTFTTTLLVAIALFADTIPIPVLIVLAAATITVMNGTNSFITASKFTRLTDKDLQEIEERPLRLHHPLW